MCRLFLITAVLLFCSLIFNAKAQDIIVKQNGEKINTRIVSANDTLVKYKNFDDPEFITYNMAGSEIRMIIYENGKRKIFGIDLARSYVAVSWGGIHPNGKYKQDGDGDAKVGKGAIIDGCFYLKNRKWGIGFELAGFQNGMNSSYLDSRLKNNLDSSEKVSTIYGNYSAGWISMGPQYSSKINRWITWDFRYSLGILNLSKPTLDYLYSNGRNSVHFATTKGSGKDLVRSLYSGFRFNFTKKFAVKVSLQYVSSNPIVNYDTQFSVSDSMGNIISSGVTNNNQKLVHFRSFNTMIGISYQFGDDRIKADKRKMYLKYPKSYIEVVIGGVNPIGEYGKNDVSQNDAGFAKHGNYYNVNGAFYLKNSKWGLGYELSTFNNTFDSNQFNYRLNNNNNQFETTTVSYGKYTGNSISAGPQFSPRVSRWLIFDLKLSAGILAFTKPELNYTYADSSGNRLEYKLDHGLGLTVIKTITTGFRCYLTERLALRLFVQMAMAKPIVKYNQSIVQTDNSGNVTYSQSDDLKKQIHFSSLNTGIGLSYQFGRK